MGVMDTGGLVHIVGGSAGLIGAFLVSYPSLFSKLAFKLTLKQNKSWDQDLESLIMKLANLKIFRATI